ncbi:MAG: CRISPR-associated endonuclease Cas2 [Candidatus Omnitrophota bacterium]|nr:MAG: CRISPR-associated endonuclease Cas2 [Candidatus Omnitrophota bacterium]
MFILVTYDIKNDKRRLKVANELKNYGERVQYSVFECLPDAKRNEEMRRKLAELIDETEDSVRFYDLCATCIGQVEIFGMGELTEDEECWII